MNNSQHVIHLDFDRLEKRQLGLWAVLFVCVNGYLFSHSLWWMAAQLLSGGHRFQLMSLLILLAVLGWRVFSGGRIRPDMPLLAFRTEPFLFYMVSCAGFLLNERWLFVNVFSAALCVMALYGVWGLLVSSETWRKGAVPMMLIILLLPFGDYLDVYAGFPLRLFTANAASDLLGSIGYSTVSSNTVIVLENQFANVDLSCSGIKGLWAGMIFFVLLSWIERKPINFGWAWRLFSFAGLLVLTNVCRVTLIVLLALGWNQLEFANLLHQSIGIVGFAMACMVGWGLLQTLKSAPEATQSLSRYPAGKKQTLALIGVSLILVAMHTPLSQVVPKVAPLVIGLPDSWQPRAVPLTGQETVFFKSNAASVQKYRFRAQENVSGSIIFVQSRYWKAHHDPKNCLLAQGYQITKDISVQLEDSFFLRAMKVANTDEQRLALYWFQNTDETTADYSRRLYASLFNRSQRWVLVSVLLDRDVDPTNDLRQTVKRIKTLVDEHLK